MVLSTLTPFCSEMKSNIIYFTKTGSLLSGSQQLNEIEMATVTSFRFGRRTLSLTNGPWLGHHISASESAYHSSREVFIGSVYSELYQWSFIYDKVIASIFGLIHALNDMTSVLVLVRFQNDWFIGSIDLEKMRIHFHGKWTSAAESTRVTGRLWLWGETWKLVRSVRGWRTFLSGFDQTGRLSFPFSLWQNRAADRNQFGSHRKRAWSDSTCYPVSAMPLMPCYFHPSSSLCSPSRPLYDSAIFLRWFQMKTSNHKPTKHRGNDQKRKGSSAEFRNACSRNQKSCTYIHYRLIIATVIFWLHRQHLVLSSYFIQMSSLCMARGWCQSVLAFPSRQGFPGSTSTSRNQSHSYSDDTHRITLYCKLE